MDDAGRQVLRPVGGRGNRARRGSRAAGPARPRRRAPRTCPRARRQPSTDSAFGRFSSKPSPATCISAKRLADLAAMFCLRLSQPHAFEKGNERGRAAGKRAEQRAVLARQRQRAGQAAGGEMLHQAEEERQVVLFDALFVERQDQRRPWWCAAGSWNSRRLRQCPCRKAACRRHTRSRNRFRSSSVISV